MEEVIGEYILYCHENKINGKKYFGITSQKPIRRWGLNGQGYKPRNEKKTKFWMAIEKYGWDSFNHVILLENINKIIAREFEKYLIKKYNTYSNGYNSTLGGETSWNKYLLDCYNPETIMRMKKSHIGKKLTTNQKNKLRNSTKKYWENIEETKKTEVCEKIRKTKIGDKNPNSIGVICDNMLFKTITELNNYYNINHGYLYKYLNGNIKMPRTWKDKGLRYYNEEEDVNIKEYVNEKNKELTSYFARKSTVVEYNGVEYNSIRELSNKTNISYSSLNKYLRGTIATPHSIFKNGLRYKYKKNKIFMYERNNKYKQKKCVLDNLIFLSIKECQEYCKTKKINEYLSNKKPTPKKYIDRGLRYYNPETDKDLPIYIDTKNEV